MKPKKSPIPLITIVVTLLVGAFIFNTRTQRTFGTPEEMQQRMMEEMQAKAAKEPPKEQPKAPEGAASKKLGEAIAGASKPKPSAVQQDGEGGGPMSGQAGKRVLIEDPSKVAPPKPTPNESAVSGQWWKK